MGKWKKFMAVALAVSMAVPFCIPQTLLAAELKIRVSSSYHVLFIHIFLIFLLRMHKFTLFSLNIIVISEKNVIFALVLRTISTK